MTWKRGRERSGCIDRRHKIHFMTWTLSSDWCISRRIASQIKRSSTLEPPLTTSPHPCRRRTVVRRHQLSFVSLPFFSTFVLDTHTPYLSLPPSRYYAISNARGYKKISSKKEKNRLSRKTCLLFIRIDRQGGGDVFTTIRWKKASNV